MQFGKPLYSTRIITDELNPSFEETTVIMLTQNEVDAQEDLSAMLWDSDDRTAEYALHGSPDVRSNPSTVTCWAVSRFP